MNLKKLAKYYFIILSLFLIWLGSVYGISLESFSPMALGPFQFVRPSFWIGFILTGLFFMFILSQKTPHHIIVLCSIIFYLYSFGTISMIEPLGRMHDTFQAATNTNAILSQGSFKGIYYVDSYPSFFVILASLRLITNLPASFFARFFPILLVPIYMVFTYYCIKSWLERYGSRNDYNYTKIWGFSFMFISLFGAIFMMRFNPVASTAGYVFSIFVLGAFLSSSSKYKFILLLSFAILTVMHAISPVLIIVMLGGVIICNHILHSNIACKYINSPASTKPVNKLSKHFKYIFSLVILWGIWNLVMQGIIKRAIEITIERRFTATPTVATTPTSFSIPTSVLSTTSSNELDLFISPTAHIFIYVSLALITLVLLLKLLKTEKDLSSSIFGALSILGIIFFVLRVFHPGEYVDRPMALSIIPLSIIWGIEGVKIVLANNRRLKIVFMVITLILGSVSVLTSFHSDTFDMFTIEEKEAHTYALSHRGSEHITGVFSPPFVIDDWRMYWSVYRGIGTNIFVPGSKNIDINKLYNKKYGSIVIITPQGENMYHFVEKTNKNSLYKLKQKLEEDMRAIPIYESDSAKIYYIS